MDLFRERSSCLAVRFFTAATLVSNYRDQAEGYATLTKSGAPLFLYAGVSSKHSDMVAVSQEGQETNWHRTFAVFHLISCSIWGCNRRSQQKSRLRGSHQQLLSHLKGAPLDMRKWNNHRAVLRLLEVCGLLYFICFALWVAGPWTSCTEVICLCNVKANICWSLVCLEIKTLLLRIKSWSCEARVD